MEEILELVRQERQKQDAKWGKQNHPDFFWLGILTEEVGEVAKALLERQDAQEELVQAGAVIVAWLECRQRTIARLVVKDDYDLVQREWQKGEKPMMTYTRWVEKCSACGQAHELTLLPLDEPMEIRGFTVVTAGECPVSGLTVYGTEIPDGPPDSDENTPDSGMEGEPDAPEAPPSMHTYCPDCDEHKDCLIRITRIEGSGPDYVSRGIEAEAICPDCGKVVTRLMGFVED